MRKNLITLLSSRSLLIVYILLVIGSGLLWWSMTDIQIIFGNYGNLHAYTDVLLSILIIFLFPLFLISVGYKSWKHGKRTDIDRKTGIGFIGGAIGVIISGASCCGATLAASFGLLPLMSFFPYDGLEIKLLGTLGLIYALSDSLYHLEVCKTKK